MFIIQWVLSIIILIQIALGYETFGRRYLRQNDFDYKLSEIKTQEDYSTDQYIVTYQFAGSTCDNFVRTGDITQRSYTSAYAYAQLKCFQDYSYVGVGSRYHKYKIQVGTPGQPDGYYIQYYLNNNKCDTVPPDDVSSLITINNCTVIGSTSYYTALSASVPRFAAIGAMFGYVTVYINFIMALFSFVYIQYFRGYLTTGCLESTSYLSWAKPNTCYKSFNHNHMFALTTCSGKQSYK